MANTSATLPSKYLPNDITGVTRGKSRPTVYFSDGTRYTQIHGKIGNIGHHTDIPELIFFGNVSLHNYNTYLNTREKRLAFLNLVNFDVLLQSFKDNPVVNGGRLFEIKKYSETRTTTHISRSYFETISLVEKSKLILDIRNRTNIKESVTEGGRTLYQFKGKGI